MLTGPSGKSYFFLPVIYKPTQSVYFLARCIKGFTYSSFINNKESVEKSIPPCFFSAV